MARSNKRSAFSERVRNEIARRVFRFALVVTDGRPVRLSLLVRLTRLAASANALSDWFTARRGSQTNVANPRVRAALRGWENDAYAIGGDGLRFLDDAVRRLRPGAILELGSGHSTVVLAAAMADLYGESGGAHIFSIDESEDWLETTRHLLRRASLGRRVKLAHRPLRECVVAGRLSRCYDLSDDFLSTFLDAHPSLLLIDGPSGGGYSRLATLPLALDRLARPCTFFLDDAWRTAEVEIASLWCQIEEATLVGVHPLGHGVLEGRLR